MHHGSHADRFIAALCDAGVRTYGAQTFDAMRALDLFGYRYPANTIPGEALPQLVQ